MTKAIVYTRYSPQRNEDKSESCETQLAYCEKLALERGWKIGQVFEDRAASGSDEDRPVLWGAIQALEAGSVLLVYKLDRLARNVYLAELIRRAVEAQHCEIHAVLGDVDGNGPEQTMIRQVLAAIAEYERRIIALRTKYAMRHHQANGRRMSRYAPYGMAVDPYTAADPDKKTLLIENPDEQRAVHLILHVDSKGKSLHEVVVYMNSEAKDLARGGQWTKRDIKRILERM